MADLEATISALWERRAELQALGVQRLYLFGSTARDEAGDNSDIAVSYTHLTLPTIYSV